MIGVTQRNPMHETLAIDIATELAEGFALPPGGIPTSVLADVVLPESERPFHARHAADRFDDEVLPVISSAHLACGLHSGDPLMIQRVVPLLVACGVQIGAHPSYPDVFNFGQERIPMAPDELVAVLLYQFGALQGVLTAHGERVRHVKCHGALYFDIAEEAWACDCLIAAVKAFDPTMTLVLPAGTPCVDQARAAGLAAVEEGYADRGYGTDGRILPRHHPKALIDSATDAARQVIGMSRDGRVTTDDGSTIPLRARTFCLHSDTPSAGEFARAIVEAVRRDGIDIKPIGALAAD